MKDAKALERCLSYLDCHFKSSQGTLLASGAEHAPVVTISRQTGAGGTLVADRLAELLQSRQPDPTCPWTVFDRNLVEKVLEDHKLPRDFAQFMPEDKVSAVADAVEELLGLHPPSWKLAHQTTETILQLAELGNVILVGRGANVITGNLPHAFHVRLVGSLEYRLKRVMDRHRISRPAAYNFIRKEDAGRRRYLQKYFRQDIDDPLLYHLVINTDWVPVDQAAALIARAMDQARVELAVRDPSEPRP